MLASTPTKAPTDYITVPFHNTLILNDRIAKIIDNDMEPANSEANCVFRLLFHKSSAYCIGTEHSRPHESTSCSRSMIFWVADTDIQK